LKLMTKEIENRIPNLYQTEGQGEDKLVHVKFFSFFNGWTWYAVEYDPIEQLFYGLVHGFEKEWGYFSLKEFEDINKSKGFAVIERDLYFDPTPVKDLVI
jgi:hypothetical protein